MNLQKAPPLQTTDWLNIDKPLSLDHLRGKVIMIEAFQMLCPGCVSHGLPLAQRVHNEFVRDDVIVIGLHTVFEHHAVQGTRQALEAFLHEYKITFPVAIDAPSGQGDIPQTMRSYRMNGTPSLILIDKQGQLRKQNFGIMPELTLGAEIMSLILESDQPIPEDSITPIAGGCDSSGCRIE